MDAEAKEKTSNDDGGSRFELYAAAAVRSVRELEQLTAASLLLASTIEEEVPPEDNPQLFYTAAFFTDSARNLQWKWQSAGICFLLFLLSSKHLRKKKPNLFWVSAIAPFMVVIIGGIFTFLVKGNEHGIPIQPQGLRMLWALGDSEQCSEFIQFSHRWEGKTLCKNIANETLKHVLWESGQPC